MGMPIDVTSLPQLPPLPQSVLAGKLPHWDLSDLTHRDCPVCANADSVNICKRPDGLIVSECMGCHMVFLPWIPSKAQLVQFYAKYSEYKEFGPPSWLRKIFSIKKTRSPHLQILLSTGGIQGQRICEIGCSYGDFLDQCRRENAIVLGVEWDERVIKYLATRKIKVVKELPDHEQFDVICAFQLIEHLEQPKNFIRKAASLLRRDGRLLLSLPNGGEISAIGATWLGFRVDLEHVNYFSISSLSEALSDCGLYIENYWEYGQPSVSRQQNRSLCARVLSRITGVNSRPEVPMYSEGKFVLSVMARKP